MGSLILCHSNKAKHPYEIIRIHKKIYTIEELCYYLCNHLFLIDYTLMNHSLCSWIARELSMNELSAKLRMILVKNGSVEQFILTILESSKLYSIKELDAIALTLERLKDHKEIEREKYKADTLFGSMEYDAAILIYRSILGKERDETVEDVFYGKIYANLGSCYGRLFLYDEAVKSYEKAYKILKEKSILRAYLYSCYKAYPQQEYVTMLSKNAELLSMDRRLQENIKKQKQKADLDIHESELEEWKKEYRKFDNK